MLEDAGLGPEQPGERALAFPCRNAPVEVLLVRAADVPEYVQDGVVDCGITGIDLVRERGAAVSELLPLGFGGCRLEAAVPEDSPVTSLGVLLESEAVLVARDEEAAAPFAAMLRAVVEARRHRYVMLNAPRESVPAITRLVSPRVPSVLPLAEDGMVAVHALVPSADVWRLLPELEAAGGSSILIVPVERMT